MSSNAVGILLYIIFNILGIGVGLRVRQKAKQAQKKWDSERSQVLPGISDTLEEVI